MKIGIIGAGRVGRTLGERWIGAGHDVRFGLRAPGSRKHAALGEHAVSLDAARNHGEILVLATPWDAARDAVSALGPLAGKVLVDCTNPLLPGLAGLAHGTETSGAEQVARWARGARVVKAFNTVGVEIMADPVVEGRKAVMFVCGDDRGAKAMVRELSDDLGFETLDAGPLSSARFLEPFALLWITGAYEMGLGRRYAFSIVRHTD